MATLKSFNEAKESITEIMDRTRDSLLAIQQFNGDHPGLIGPDQVQTVGDDVSQVARLRKVVASGQMKVVFTGRTSNGKSTAINAILHQRILPSGASHTTNCCVQVEGTTEAQAYILRGNQRRNVGEIQKLANALSAEVLSESSLVQLCCPKQSCQLLSNYIVILDVPGVDKSAGVDKWVVEHSLNADVFVLVADGVSIITEAEIKFLREIRKRRSTPNVFVLFNKWDSVANPIIEEVPEKTVREKQLQECQALLVDLGVCTKEEANGRIFCVSAVEALAKRLNRSMNAAGFDTRYSEFEDFERKLKEYLSISALRSKFHQPSRSGKEIAERVSGILSRASERARTLREEQIRKKESGAIWIARVNEQLPVIKEEVKNMTGRLSEFMERRCSAALYWEVVILKDSIIEYTRRNPFPDERDQYETYEKNLNDSMKEKLWSGLPNRTHAALSEGIDLTTDLKFIIQEIRNLLPTEMSIEDTKSQVESKIDQLEKIMLGTSVGNPKDNPNGLDKSAIPAEKWSDVENMVPVGLASLTIAGATPFVFAAMPLLAVPVIGFGVALGAVVTAGILRNSTKSDNEKAFFEAYTNNSETQLREFTRSCSSAIKLNIETILSNTLSQFSRILEESITDIEKETPNVEERVTNLQKAEERLKLMQNGSSKILNDLQSFEDKYFPNG